MSWDSPSWKEAAADYHRLRGNRDSLANPADAIRLREILDPKVSLDEAWRRINAVEMHPTPQVVVEALMYCVRTRGIAALKEPANVERLSRCDEAAMRQLNERIEKLTAKEKQHATP